MTANNDDYTDAPVLRPEPPVEAAGKASKVKSRRKAVKPVTALSAAITALLEASHSKTPAASAEVKAAVTAVLQAKRRPELSTDIELHAAQQRAVDSIERRGVTWLAGDMGCGKTFTSLFACRDGTLGVVVVHEVGVGRQWEEAIRQLGLRAVYISQKRDIKLLEAALNDPSVNWIVTTYEALARTKRRAMTPAWEAAFKLRVAAVEAHNERARREDGKIRRKPRWPRELAEVAKVLQAALAGNVVKLVLDESQTLNSLHGPSPSKRSKAMKKFVADNFRPQREAGVEGLKCVLLSGTFVTGRDTDLISQYDVADVLADLDGYIDRRNEVVELPNGGSYVAEKINGWVEDYKMPPPPAPTLRERLEERRVHLSRAEMFEDVPDMTRKPWLIDVVDSDEELAKAMIADERSDEDTPELEMIRHDFFHHAAHADDSDSDDGQERGRWWFNFFRLGDEFARQMRRERKSTMRITKETMPMYMFGCSLRTSMNLLLPAAGERIAALAATGQTLVFAEFYKSLTRLAAHLPAADDFVYYVGAGQLDQHGKKLTDKTIRRNFEQFKAGEKQLMLATYSKGGTGLCLAGVPNVVLAGRTARIALMKQAECRIYRYSTRIPTYSYTAVGAKRGQPLKIETTLARIADEKKARAARVGLAGTLG